MNSSIEFKRGLTEVAMVIHHLPSELKDKIPIEFKQCVLDKMDTRFTPVPFDKNKTLDEQDISKDAKKILASIYINYMATDEEKEQFVTEEKEKTIKLEEEKKRRYGTDVFNKTKKPFK